MYTKLVIFCLYLFTLSTYCDSKLYLLTLRCIVSPWLVGPPLDVWLSRRSPQTLHLQIVACPMTPPLRNTAERKWAALVALHDSGTLLVQQILFSAAWASQLQPSLLQSFLGLQSNKTRYIYGLSHRYIYFTCNKITSKL